MLKLTQQNSGGERLRLLLCRIFSLLLFKLSFSTAFIYQSWQGKETLVISQLYFGRNKIKNANNTPA